MTFSWSVGERSYWAQQTGSAVESRLYNFGLSANQRLLSNLTLKLPVRLISKISVKLGKIITMTTDLETFSCKKFTDTQILIQVK